MRMIFLAGLIEVATAKGRRLLTLERQPTKRRVSTETLMASADKLLSIRGESSGISFARDLLDDYSEATDADRQSFLEALTEKFGADPRRLAVAVESFKREPNSLTIQELHLSAEARRKELIRRLNQAPDGTRSLVRMREDVLKGLSARRPLKALDADFLHLFTSWFNRGFLVLHRVDWNTPANVLEKIIQYEAVHAIQDWTELRRRIDPPDRRCFAFFHPQLTDEPLIFVEVALTREVPGAIAPLLKAERVSIRASEATTAVFYSISNCQQGLAGASFGNFLIKQVVEELKAELPNLTRFVTLSPIPGFAQWLALERRTEDSLCLSLGDKALLDTLGPVERLAEHRDSPEIQRFMTTMIAEYLLNAKNDSGRPIDPVARFHLGNGARVERVNWMGDTSPKGLQQGLGFMVNYLYDLKTVVENHEAFANNATVQASSAIRKLARRTGHYTIQMKALTVSGLDLRKDPLANHTPSDCSGTAST